MNGFFGRKATAGSLTQRTFSRLMMTSALVAAGSLALVSPAKADNSWAGLSQASGTFTTDATNPNITNIQVTTVNGRAIGVGNADIYLGDTVNVDASLFVVRDNRADPTQILGRLNSNGKIIVIDGNGVYFGKNAVVDVSSIVATTGDVNDAAVMAGDTTLQLSNFGTGQVVNDGVIRAIGGASDYGLVALVAPTVKNNGVINAYMGRVALAAGNETATVDLYGDGLLSLAYTDKNDALLSENKGKIEAFGGKIQMTAAAAKDVVDSVVNMQGIARANSATVTGGKIVLSAKKVKVGSFSTVKGDTTVTAKSVDLGSTIDGNVGGSAKEVNVLSNNAKIFQGLNIVDAGGTVNVGAGTYNEHLIIDKQGVTLNGAKAGINGSDSDRGTGETIIIPNSPGVTITADNVTVDGFTFTGAVGADGYGIFVNGADNVTLKNNDISNTSQSGIYILNSNFATITGNNIGEYGAAGNIQGDGIRLVRGNGAVITDNVIGNIAPLVTGYGSGIYAVLSNNLQIGGGSLALGNYIVNAAWDGIKLVSSNNANVQNNLTNQIGRAGISVSTSNGVTLRENAMIYSGMWGIWGQGNTNFSIIGNGISHVDGAAAEHGIYIEGGSDLLIDQNQINHTKLQGIHIQDVSPTEEGGTVISRNIVNNTGSHGVWVSGSLATSVEGNFIGTLGGVANIKGDGIRIINSSNSVLYNNVINETKPTDNFYGNGIYSLFNDNIIIGGVGKENTITNTGWDGIKIQGGTGAQVLNNVISGVNRAGVSAYQTTDATIANNSITNSGKWGVWSARNLGLDILGNTINGTNELDGIYAFADTNLLIDGNDISHTKTNGIMIDSALAASKVGPNVTVSHNDINSTGSHGVYVLSSDNVYVRYNNIGMTGGAGNIKGDGVRGVFANGLSVHGNFIKNLAPAGNGFGSGVYINYSNNASATYNDISNAKWDGVKVGFGDNYLVKGNNIHDVTRAGVSANDTTNSTITLNSINNMGRWGMWTVNNEGLNIVSNKISNIGREGILSDNDFDMTMSYNTITGTGLDGIHSTNGSGVLTITNNTLSSIGGNGIYVGSFGGSSIVMAARLAVPSLDLPSFGELHINDNSITNADINGIFVDGASGYAEILRNDIYHVGNDGIKVLNYDPSSSTYFPMLDALTVLASGLYVDNNDIYDAHNNGISLLNTAGHVEANNNVIDTSVNDGIHAEGYDSFFGEGLYINRNNIYNSGNNGISIVATSGHVEAVGNYIYNSRNNGIWAYNYYSPLMTLPMETLVVAEEYVPTVEGLYLNNNIIDTSANSGIEVSNSVGNIYINGNSITHSGWNGIYVNAGKKRYYDFFYDAAAVNLQISGNEIVNQNNGIYLNGINGSIDVLGNNIYNSTNDGILVDNVNQSLYIPPVYEAVSLFADVVAYPTPIVEQLTIAKNSIDNSMNNGIELYNVGGTVTVAGNVVTDSGNNGLVARNFYGPIMEGKSESLFSPYIAVYPSSNPIQLTINDNVIQNIGYDPLGTTTGSEKIVAEKMLADFVPADYLPLGNAAINLDISADGSAVIGGNRIGDNFHYGLLAYSGSIDLTGVTNIVQNSGIGLAFYPADYIPETDTPEYFTYLASQLHLVNDTIGTTAFVNQSDLFVDLGYGAFFAPGSPTLLDGRNATYTLGGVTIAPALNGGLVTPAEYSTLETYINHYNDSADRGLFFFDILSGITIDQKDVLRNFFTVPFNSPNGGTLTVTGLPNVGGGNGGGTPPAPAPFNPNAIEPAAGGEEVASNESGAPGNVADIQPASGGEANSACWADASQSLSQGSPVTFNYGSDSAALLQAAANCGNGPQNQGQAL